MLLPPDRLTDIGDLESKLFSEFVPQLVCHSLVRFDAAGARPQPVRQLRVCAEVGVHQEHAMQCVEHDGAGSRA
jgi:hypothetical protein